jgi:translation elongation factor EF-G
MLEKLAKEGRMTILEPTMNVEIWVSTSRVGDVLSDLTGRRGTIDVSQRSKAVALLLNFYA